MTLHYTQTYADLVDYHDATWPRQTPDSGTYHFYLLATNAAFLACAYLCVVSLNLILVAMMLLALAASNLWRGLPYSKFRRLGIEKVAASNPRYPISLEFLEEGLRETVEGIVTFAPWSSIVRAYKTKGIIVVEFTTNQYAIIPCSILPERHKTPDDIIALIESHLPKSTSGIA